MINNLSSFVGQASIKEEIQRRLPRDQNAEFPHLLLSGPPEIGKVTLAYAISAELGVGAVATSASALQKKLDFVGVFTNLKSSEVIVLEDIDACAPDVIELLTEAIADRCMSILIGTGPGARLVAMDLRPFVMLATTTKLWRVPAQLRRWFITFDFHAYSSYEMGELLVRLATTEGLAIDAEAAGLLTDAIPRTPGSLVVLLKRAKRHYAASVPAVISAEEASHLLDILGYSRASAGRISLADRLQLMNGQEFETFVADLFVRLGFVAELTATTGDHGIDILLNKGGEKGAVQCKRWSDNVGESAVRDLLGAMKGTDARVGYLVTTSSFSEQAREFAHRHGIRLLDLEAVLEMASAADQIRPM